MLLATRIVGSYYSTSCKGGYFAGKPSTYFKFIKLQTLGLKLMLETSNRQNTSL